MLLTIQGCVSACVCSLCVSRNQALSGRTGVGVPWDTEQCGSVCLCVCVCVAFACVYLKGSQCSNGLLHQLWSLALVQNANGYSEIVILISVHSALNNHLFLNPSLYFFPLNLLN